MAGREYRVPETPSVIPERLVEFARALCRVARDNRIDNMEVRFSSGIYNKNMEWPSPIQVSWEQGRHGAADDVMHLSSEVTLHRRITGPFELDPKLVTVPEPTPEQLGDAAEKLWEDMHARHGGTWPGVDSELVAVKQCVATARAMLMAAWRPR